MIWIATGIGLIVGLIIGSVLTAMALIRMSDNVRAATVRAQSTNDQAEIKERKRR